MYCLIILLYKVTYLFIFRFYLSINKDTPLYTLLNKLPKVYIIYILLVVNYLVLKVNYNNTLKLVLV